MKKFTLTLIAFIAISMFFYSCTGCGNSDPVEEQQTEELQEIDSLLNEIQKDTTKQIKEVELVKPVVKEEAKKVIDQRLQNSPFSKHECCNGKLEEIGECCGALVLVDYTKLMEDDPKKAGEYSRTDPILIKCKEMNGLSELFQAVDYPDDDEDGFD